MGAREEEGRGGAEMNSLTSPGPWGMRLFHGPLSASSCCSAALPQPSAYKQAHLTGPSGAPKCCLLMLFLSFSEPQFFKIRLSELEGIKPLNLGKKKTHGNSDSILVSLCAVGKGVKEI